MGDIHNNLELANYVASREGCIPHMYCDRNNLVTVGYGYMMRTEQAATRVVSHYHLNFYHQQNGNILQHRVATLDDVRSDWRNVNDTRARVPVARTITRLRLPRESCVRLLSLTINGFVDIMYRRFPWAPQLDDYIQFALIDARFNPAGVGFIDTANPHIRRMWEALSPDHQDLDAALEAFVLAWRDRGNNQEPYKVRKKDRIEYFRRGIERMRAH